MVRKFSLAFLVASSIVAIGYFLPHPQVSPEDEAPYPSIVEYVEPIHHGKRILPPPTHSAETV